MTERQYIYKVDRIERIVDGDTFWLHLDVGFRQSQLTCIRLDGFDTPEMNVKDDREREAGTRATRITHLFFALPMDTHTYWVQTKKDPDSFGRWLGNVWVEGQTTGTKEYLGEYLMAGNLATEWPTRWRDVYLDGTG